MGRLAFGLAIAAGFLWLAFRDVPLGELHAAFAQLEPRWLVAAVAISVTLQVFRAWRWQLELRPLARVPLGVLWPVTSVAYMAINVLPGRIGEVVRPWLLSRRAPVSFSNVVGSLIVEKTMDSAVIVFYILLGLLTTRDLPLLVRRGALVPAAAFVALAVLVVLLWWQGERFVDRWIARWLPVRLGARVLAVARALVEGMRVLGDARLASAVFVVSLALWFLPILSSWVMIRAFDLGAPFNAALVVFIFIGFGTALPQAPGMIGTYQYACILALGLFGVPQSRALAYGLVLNAVQLGTLVAQGLVALPLAGVSLRDVVRARTSAAR
ncbi:MAG: lysylphosphatidylglycerol synthase transmembrane domain-containing protein [Candidatus Binatia bacterium]